MKTKINGFSLNQYIWNRKSFSKAEKKEMIKYAKKGKKAAEHWYHDELSKAYKKVIKKLKADLNT